MTHIDRELADHLLNLGAIYAQRPAPRSAGAAAARYLEESLAGWGYRVAPGLPLDDGGPEPLAAGAPWQVVGRIGMEFTARVQLSARLGGGAEGAAGLAVLMALGRLLAQHALRHGLELVAYGGARPAEVRAGPVRSATPQAAGPIVAALSFDDPGRPHGPNTLSAAGVSASLATGVRGLLVRYPEVLWCDGPPWAPELADEVVPRVVVGGGGQGGARLDGPRGPLGEAQSPRRLREATILGAEIVALLQRYTAAACRPGVQGVGV